MSLKILSILPAIIRTLDSLPKREFKPIEWDLFNPDTYSNTSDENVVKLKIPHPTQSSSIGKPIELDICALTNENNQLYGKCQVKYSTYKTFHKITCYFVENILWGIYTDEISYARYGYTTDYYLEKCIFQHGLIQGWYELTKNSVLTCHCYYINGKRNGPYEENYDDGTSKIRSNYVNGTQVILEEIFK